MEWIQFGNLLDITGGKEWRIRLSCDNSQFLRKWVEDQHNNVPYNSLTSLLLLCSSYKPYMMAISLYPQIPGSALLSQCVAVVSSSWNNLPPDFHMACFFTFSNLCSNSTFSILTSPIILLRTATLILILGLPSVLPWFFLTEFISINKQHFICFVSSSRNMSLEK